MSNLDRRSFLQRMALSVGGAVLVPSVTSCVTGPRVARPDAQILADIPFTRPAGWDPITYNRTRGNAGAIPSSYLRDVNGRDGDWDHVGKHLPYIPTNVERVERYVPIMWGDPAKGHTPHPNDPPAESNNFEGHWYDWIRVRKAVPEHAVEMQSFFSGWPNTEPSDNGAYMVHGGGDITANGGANTIYLTAVPPDVQPGDLVRVWAHCLTHGEYIDFLTVDRLA